MRHTNAPRRTFLAAAGGAAASLAASAPVAAAPGAAKPAAPAHRKQVVAISSDNPVYGASAAAFEQWGYAPAVKAGGLLFVAGVVGLRPDGSVPPGAAEQGELAMRRLVELLRLEGLGMADLVEVVSYHVDLANNLDAFMPVKARYFERPFPAWTLLGIEALGLPELKVEIRAVAALRA